ncbi:uncharacterized protein LOC143081645 [Mytilus galloprovincialis]|uniref:uncharacterized protein LOC143081645 n=1 Tax=Mytilus galloprovincialis TaxID=29158 RepID=UPI003F7C993D
MRDTASELLMLSLLQDWFPFHYSISGVIRAHHILGTITFQEEPFGTEDEHAGCYLIGIIYVVDILAAEVGVAQESIHFTRGSQPADKLHIRHIIIISGVISMVLFEDM